MVGNLLSRHKSSISKHFIIIMDYSSGQTTLWSDCGVLCLGIEVAEQENQLTVVAASECVKAEVGMLCITSAFMDYWG